jgi:alpha-2-macroglobulin
MFKKISWLFVLTILAMTTFTGCKQRLGSIEFKEGYKAYIYAYTSGVISRASPIRIRFTQALVDEKMIGNTVEKGLLTFEPNIEGTAIWEDDRTIKFVATENLPSGEGYFGRVDIDNLYDNVPKDLRTFLFDFKTKDQFFEVEIEGLRSMSNTDLTKEKLVGTLVTADVSENEKVEELLTATQKDNKDLEVTWQHDADQIHHHFVVNNVARKKAASEVKLAWKGKAIGVKKSGDETVTVPALGDFVIANVSVVQEEEQCILVEFSDPISKMQDVEGLIMIEGVSTASNHIIDGNTIRIYPASRIAGTRTINIQRGIQNVMNEAMKKPSEWTVEFAEIAPEVKLVGTGVILPNSDKGLIFPFDAVSLNAVDVEIFKIFENNVLQFLQTNNLDGDYEMERVGRVVLQKKIPLNALNPMADFSMWTRYALDLNDLIKREPNAIYQVRIGFQQSYSTYFCTGETAEVNDGMTILESGENLNEDGEINSFWEEGYGYYDWEQKDNPCNEAYYKSYYRKDRFAHANIIASDLGLIAKQGDDGSYFVAVSNLQTTKPLSGVTVKFYDFQQQVIQHEKTDSDGVVMTKIKRKPFFVVAEKGKERGYLKLQDGYSLSLSRYDVGGAAAYKGIKGFLYGDRGVWRPGDSLYLSFILEDKLGNLPASHPVTFELFNPRGQLQQKIVKTDNVNHIYDFRTATSPDAPTGNWQAQITVGGAVFTERLKIETVKPNRLKILLDFGKKELVADDDLEGNLQVNWLHGATASNIKTEVKVQLHSTQTTFKNYGDYIFDDPARSFSGAAQTIYNQETDADGKGIVKTKINTNDAAPGKMKANFSIRAYEKSGDFSSDNFSMPYNPYDGYVGIRLPVKRSGEKRLDMDKDYNLNLVSLAANGKIRGNKKIKVGLYRVNWRWWWDSGSDNVSNYSSSTHYGAVKKADLTTNAKGEATWKVNVDDWGRYMVRVCDEETGHCTGDIFYAGYPWDEEGDNAMTKEAAAMLSFSSDKTKYNVGETVELKVPLSESGRALITIENGTKVLETFWKTAQKGDNTFTFTATKSMAPNVYAHVTLVQPHAQVQNDLPIRMYGVLPIMVEDPKTRLEPQIAMPNELAPKQTFTVQVSEKNRNPMAYTLAIVDEGLLDLTRFKTPDPWNHFYAKEALGVKTWDMYDYVMGAYTGSLERILSIGGDDALGPREGQKANRFKPVVHFVGPFYLKSGTKTHKITMPNYVGSVRVMVVASDNGAYGNAEKTVPVKKPLMVLGTLPRVLSPGESVKLPVTVFAMENSIRNVNVKIETNGLLSINGSNSQSITFSKTGDKIVDFDLTVPENIGVAKVKIIATSGKETATQEIELDVRNPNPYVTDVYAAVIEKGQSWSQAANAIGMTGTNTGILEVSNIPPINLGERLHYLIQYPHGCIEQTISAGFPQLYVNALMDLDEKTKAKVDDNIQATLEKLKAFQTTSGGFGYWAGDSEASDWGTTYAGHFMIEAQKQGFSLPPSMLDKWKKYQRKIAKTWTGSADYYNTDLDQAYRLYTLAIADVPEWGTMNRLKERPNLSDAARWRLAAAYAIAGKKAVAQSLIKSLNTNIKPYRELAYTYGSDVRDQAMILETLTAMGERTKAGTILKKVAASLSKDEWYSTQTTAYALLAIGKFVGTDKPNNKFTFTYSIGGKSTNATSKNAVVQKEFKPGKTAKVNIKNTSGGILFARVILQGQPTTGDQTNSASNLKLAINYKSLDGKPIDVSNIIQGSDFIAEVTVTNPGQMGNYSEMSLTQIFPSGWEIHNTRMDNVATYSNTNIPEYQDIRDDRVYSYFDIFASKTQTYRIQLNAAYQGRFYLPTVYCEAMYDNNINARQAGRWVSVVSPSVVQ